MNADNSDSTENDSRIQGIRKPIVIMSIIQWQSTGSHPVRSGSLNGVKVDKSKSLNVST